MSKPRWETVTEAPANHTDRLKVYGGWIVRTKYAETVSTVSVPDPQHHWDLENPSKGQGPYLPDVGE